MDDVIRRIVELQVRASQDSVRRLDEIARSAKGVEDRMARAQTSVTDFAKLGLGAIATYVTTGAIVNGLLGIAKALDDIGDAAERAGTTSGAMGFLHELAKLNELDDLTTLERGLRQFSISMADANDEGSKAAKMLRAMRFELTDGDPVGNLARFAVEYSKIESASLRAAVQQEVFGKTGHALHQTLIALAKEQGNLTERIDEYDKKNRTAIAAAGLFDQNIKNIKKSLYEMSVTIAGPVLESLNAFINGANSSGMDSALGKIRDTVHELIVATGLFKETESWAASHGRLVTGTIKRAGEGPALPGESSEAGLESAHMQNAIRSALSGNAASSGGGGRGRGGRAAAAPSGQSWADFSGGWSPQALRWDMESRGLAGDATGPAEEIHQIQDALDRLTGQDKVKELSANLGLLHDAMDRGAISAEQYDDAVQRLFADTIPDNVSKTQDALKAVSTGITDFAGDIAEALVDADTNIGQKFESIVRNFAKFLIRMQAEAAARPIANWLTNLFGGGIGAMSGGSGGAVQGSDYFGSWGTGAGSWNANGNAFGPLGLMALASGGVVSRPTLFGHGGGLGLMGESGPEAVMPLRRGPSGKLGVEGTAPVVNVPVQVVVENKSSAQVGSVRETRGANGMREIRVLIQDAVRAGIVSGEFDSALSSGYGLVRNGRR